MASWQRGSPAADPRPGPDPDPRQPPSLATAAGHQDATVAAMAARIQLQILTLVRIQIRSSCLPGRRSRRQDATVAGSRLNQV